MAPRKAKVVKLEIELPDTLFDTLDRYAEANDITEAMAASKIVRNALIRVADNGYKAHDIVNQGGVSCTRCGVTTRQLLAISPCV